MNSPDHSTKGTPSRRSERPKPPPQFAPTACRYRGSGSLSSPSRGAFHLSLTVLVHYRWLGVFSLGGWSPQLPAGFLVSRGTQERRPPPRTRRLRDSHPLRWRFPAPSADSASWWGLLAALQPRPHPK